MSQHASAARVRLHWRHMSVMTFHITGNSIVYSTASACFSNKGNIKAGPHCWSFVRGIDSPHKGPVIRKGFSVLWRHRGFRPANYSTSTVAKINLSRVFACVSSHSLPWLAISLIHKSWDYMKAMSPRFNLLVYMSQMVGCVQALRLQWNNACN